MQVSQSSLQPFFTSRWVNLFVSFATVQCVQIKSGLAIKYASDDTDDLLGSIITNTHKSKEKEKPKGAVDSLVEEAYAKAMKDYKND